MLLAKRLSDFRGLERKAVRVIVYEEDITCNARLEFTTDKGYAAGFDSLVSSVMHQLPQREYLAGVYRTKEILAPEVIIREVLANALIHQELDFNSTWIFVRITRKWVKVTNPGLPLIPEKRFIDMHFPRNDRIVDLMRRFGICEGNGTGFDRVVEAAERLQLPAPDFRSGYRSTEVFVCGQRSFQDTDWEDRYSACLQHCALQWEKGERMTNQSLHNRLGASSANERAKVRRVISAALEHGRIKSDPAGPTSGRQARYIPTWA